MNGAETQGSQRACGAADPHGAGFSWQAGAVNFTSWSGLGVALP
ncbi:Hypothetical protein A7982_06335 [Minicystis rosea]|nr:Hypothetical protein A7982_06335 [Minicystis rosea]